MIFLLLLRNRGASSVIHVDASGQLDILENDITDTSEGLIYASD